MVDERFVEGEVGVALDLDETSALDPKTTELLGVAGAVAVGSPAVWSGAPPEPWPPGRRRTRSPTCC
jgi:hypothetical protein